MIWERLCVERSSLAWPGLHENNICQQKRLFTSIQTAAQWSRNLHGIANSNLQKFHESPPDIFHPPPPPHPPLMILFNYIHIYIHAYINIIIMHVYIITHTDRKDSMPIYLFKKKKRYKLLYDFFFFNLVVIIERVN